MKTFFGTIYLFTGITFLVWGITGKIDINAMLIPAGIIFLMYGIIVFLEEIKV